MKEKIRANYHWVIALVALLEMTVYGGVCNNLNSVFVIPVTESLGISRGSFSLVLSISSLAAFVITTVSSPLFLRFGYRKLVAFCLILGGVSLAFVMGGCQNLAVLGIGAVLYGASTGVCSTASATRIVGDWFHRHRGLVLGLVSAATGLGGSLFCILQTNIIAHSGWRNAYRFSGLMWVITAAIIAVTVRNRPDQMGLRPYGEGQLPQKKRHRGGHSESSWAGFSLQELVRKPTFYLMMVLTLLSCLCLYLAFYVVVPHMQDCGLTAAQAATVQSVMLLCMSAVKLFCGWLSDVIGPRWVTVLCLAFGSVGMFLLTCVTNMPQALVFICIYTFCLPLTTITIPLLTTELFGYRGHDTAVGLFLAMVNVGSMIASPLSNLIYDAVGSYKPTIKVSAAAALVLLAGYELLFLLAGREKRRWQAAWAEKAQKG